ncbi:niban-like protein 1 [Dendronephthya gigantea]|uniref:niban-like protein 1 n=1 Tax=Dendronephthya gigantea TaxID=151771 RepID=UPI00106C3196|nr:niban-like protein 1 [Dendronephthya gigantea]
MGNIIPVDSRKRQEIEDLANSMLEIFAAEYRTIYGCEVLTSYEKSDEQKFPFSLKFCPWERINYPIKKGYLTKQGVIRKSWKKRYFVVQPNYLVDYYENEEAYDKDLKPKGTINPSGYRTVSNLGDELARRQKDLANMLGVDQQDSPEKFPNHTFGVVHDASRSYYIHAESEEEKMEWVQMFQLCCACVKGFNISDPICQSTFNRAISKTLITYGSPEHHSYKGPEEKVICNMVTTEIDRRFMAGICDNGKGSFAAKIKIREQVLKDVDASVLNLVTSLWKNLKEDTVKIQLEVETLIREKDREIAAVRRKVEWDMNGKTEMFLKDALADVKSYSQRVFPILENSMFDALCEVRNIYQRSVVEIGVDVEQREEVEIPIQMYIDSLDMLARTPSEIQTAYKLLDSMEKELTSAQHDLKTFDVATIMLQAQERLRHVMDALVNTFQKRFLEESCGVEGNQKHKQLRSLIEEIDDEVANNFENDLREVIYSFNMKTLKMLFIPYIHNNIDENCKKLVESADVSVIPDHLTIVINRRNEYKRLVEKSVEELLKQVMNTKDEAKQRSFKKSLRNSRRKTFPTFSSRQTKFQDASNDRMRKTTLPATKINGVFKSHDRKASLTNLFACLPIQPTQFRDSGVYDVIEAPQSSEDNMQEITLTLTRGSVPAFGSKT